MCCLLLFIQRLCAQTALQDLLTGSALAANLKSRGLLLWLAEEEFEALQGSTHLCIRKLEKAENEHELLGNVSETPTPTTCRKSTAVHLQFVRQYAPRTFLASKLRRKGNPAIHLPFVLQYASHLYGSTPPICTAVLLENTGGWGHRNVSETLTTHEPATEQKTPQTPK